MREDWEVKKLGDICEISYGNRVVKNRDCGSLYPVYGGGGATFFVDSFNRENTVIISRFGMSPKCVRFVKGKFFLNDSGLSLIANQNIICQSYLDMAMFALNDAIYSLGKGAAQKNLDVIAFNKLNIKYPTSLVKQQQIVEELDCLTSIIDKQKKQLGELDNLAQAIFYDMFGDPITNPKGWKMNKVSNLSIKMSTGPFGSMLHKSDYTVDGIPSINPQNINNRKIITNDISKVSYQKAEELSKYIVRENNIIIARRGDLRKCAIVTNKEDGWLCGTGSFMLELKDIFPILFYYQYTSKSIQKYLNDKCIGATMPNLNQKILGGLKVIVPPFELQQQFASKIEAIEKQKELIKKSIKETEDLFNSRMDYYFN